jgi:homoserine O-acetyltransferase
MLIILVALFTAHGACAADDAPATFIIRNFRLESGVVLPEARIVYRTFGTLNAAGDNAILLPSHYMADSTGYRAVIGADRALDPAAYFLVATELFGNGHSSSPSNTPAPFNGPRFPVTSIRDNVAALHRLLTEGLGIRHLRAAMGFSMGGQQVFQLAVSYPDFADRIIVTSSNAKTHPHNYIMLESVRTAIETDPVFNGGNYTTPPTRGIQAASAILIGWVNSQEYWRRELWRDTSPPGTTFQQVLEQRRAGLLRGKDANDLILQIKTWQGHDIGATPGSGGIERALGSLKMPVLYMPSESDLYFTVTSAAYEAQFIPRVTFKPIPSLLGHGAGLSASPVESKFLTDAIRGFLAEK